MPARRSHRLRKKVAPDGDAEEEHRDSKANAAAEAEAEDRAGGESDSDEAPEEVTQAAGLEAALQREQAEEAARRTCV